MFEIGESQEFYEYRFAGGKNNSYIFDTDNKITYEIKFVPSGYLFEEGHPARDFTYEYIISVLENNTGKTPPLDKKIPLTLALIFQDFLKKIEMLAFISVIHRMINRQFASENSIFGSIISKEHYSIKSTSQSKTKTVYLSIHP